MIHAHSAGVVPSLAAGAVATLTVTGDHESGAVRTAASKKGDAWPVRSGRIESAVARIVGLVPAHAYVVLEGPRYGGSASAWDEAAVWHGVLRELLHAGHAVAVVDAAALKTWATGTGRADAAAVASGVTRLIPHVELANAETAAATGLALMGAHHLGWAAHTKARAAALAKVVWPEPAVLHAA